MPIEFSDKPGLVIYLTAGDPDLGTTRAMALAAIDNGADVIELGVPFSDPLADGPVIQRASERAVARGTRLGDVLEVCREIRAARPQAGIILFSYLNPVVRMGLRAFTGAAKAAGADGVLLTDMIVEEADEYLQAMRDNGLMPVFLAAPTSPDTRLEAIATHSQGFVYAISRVGITGTQSELAADARLLVDRLRRFTSLPIALGFGVSTAEHVRAVGQFADAAVVGSALVALIEKTPAPEAPAAVGAFVRGLKGSAVHGSFAADSAHTAMDPVVAGFVQGIRGADDFGDNPLWADLPAPDQGDAEGTGAASMAQDELHAVHDEAGIAGEVEAGSVAGESPRGANR